MDGFRRTVPRSARRRRLANVPLDTLQDGGSKVGPGASNSERYVPGFDRSKPSTSAGTAQALPPIRTGVEAISPTCFEPSVTFSSAPLTCVRWLPLTGKTAIAAVGSGDGEPDMDYVSFYEVAAKQEDSDNGKHINSQLVCEIKHHGKVNDIAVSKTSGIMLYGSSDGHVRAMASSEWQNSSTELLNVCRFPKKSFAHEAVMGVVPLEHRKCFAFGSSGSVILADLETNKTLSTIEHGDAVGFRSADSFDPDGGAEAVGAGASGEVTIWDYRAGSDIRARTETLRHDDPAVTPFCVTVDPTQPNFVLAGTGNGELAIWDRRGGDGRPISRVTIHDGFIWDVQVVQTQPGLLLSCGEDGLVWLMDFGAATARGAMGTAVDVWRESGEHWRAQLTQSDLRNVSSEVPQQLGINSVSAHPSAGLYAYTSDSASVVFGSLYN